MCSCGKSKKVIASYVAPVKESDFGSKVRWVIGFSGLDVKVADRDPIVFLKEFTAAYPAGFPDHPHRGYQLLNYVLEGSLRTEDFHGHEKTLNKGDVQLVKIGRGIVHCEMAHGPNPVRAVSLWINLPEKEKMMPPSYNEQTSKNVPIIKTDGVCVKVVAGETEGTKSRIVTSTPVMILDISLNPGARHSQPVTKHWTTFVYTLFGNVTMGPADKETHAEPHTVLQLTFGDHVDFKNTGKKKARFLFIAGEPIGEPIHQYGPFVMTTEEETKSAGEDFLADRNGFEGGREWESFIVREDDLPHP